MAVSSAFLVELFHLEYSGPFLVGHSFLVGLVVGLFGWLLAWGLWRFWRVFPYKRWVKIRIKVYFNDQIESTSFRTRQQSEGVWSHDQPPVPTRDAAPWSEDPGGLETPNRPWLSHQ